MSNRIQNYLKVFPKVMHTSLSYQFLP